MNQIVNKNKICKYMFSEQTKEKNNQRMQLHKQILVICEMYIKFSTIRPRRSYTCDLIMH